MYVYNYRRLDLKIVSQSPEIDTDKKRTALLVIKQMSGRPRGAGYIRFDIKCSQSVRNNYELPVQKVQVFSRKKIQKAYPKTLNMLFFSPPKSQFILHNSKVLSMFSRYLTCHTNKPAPCKHPYQFKHFQEQLTTEEDNIFFLHAQTQLFS